ncbi:MAG: nitronate monooxygenase [Rhodospirillaceae bacterium]|nr:nitronate monooxygenase [Rhodospirillaceae bacterium]
MLNLDTLPGELALPVIGAPMFIVSVPDLVVAQCTAGVIGTFPATNAHRSDEGLDGWLTEITERNEHARAQGQYVAPLGVNLIVHRSNENLDQHLATVIEHRVPLVITSVGAPGDIAKEVHSYGGVVFHDVTNMRHARKAASSGVDGLILVCGGAGGHAGSLNPFALVPEVRAEFDMPLILSGAISSGQAVRAARTLGADFAYLGTRFIAVQEANAAPEYKQMIIESGASDITYTPEFSGLPANYLTKSILASELDPADLALPGQKVDRDYQTGHKKAQAWSVIWSAGQGVGTITDAPSTADLVARLKVEYEASGA